MSTAVAVAEPRPARSPDELIAVYVWQIPVRIAHWLIAFSIVILSVTGFYMGRPFMTVAGPATESFVMGWMKVIHGYTAYVFTTALVMRMVWMFTGNKYSHWDKFIPVHRVRQRGMWPVTAFYSFLRDKPPAYVGHNPVAAGAYTLVLRPVFPRSRDRPGDARGQCRRHGSMVRHRGRGSSADCRWRAGSITS